MALDLGETLNEVWWGIVAQVVVGGVAVGIAGYQARIARRAAEAATGPLLDARPSLDAMPGISRGPAGSWRRLGYRCTALGICVRNMSASGAAYRAKVCMRLSVCRDDASSSAIEVLAFDVGGLAPGQEWAGPVRVPLEDFLILRCAVAGRLVERHGRDREQSEIVPASLNALEFASAPTEVEIERITVRVRVAVEYSTATSARARLHTEEHVLTPVGREGKDGRLVVNKWVARLVD